MRAWRIPKRGIENAVLVNDQPIPSIKDENHVLIRVLAVGLNPVDYKWADRQEASYPYIPGIDGCGIVEKIGAKVDPNKFQEKKTVVYFHGSLWNEGYFAEFATHDHRFLSIVPPTLYEGKDLQEVACHLAALPCAGFTAYQAVCDRLRLPIYRQEKPFNFKSVKSVVVTAGAGGVGGFCLQLLALWRATFPKEEQESIKIITTCSQSNFDFVKSLGATHVIDYNKDDVKAKVMEITNNEGVDAWIENVSAESGDIGYSCLSFAGEFVSIAGSSEIKGSGARSGHIIFLGAAYKSGLVDKISEIRYIGDEMVKLYEQGKIQSLLTEVISFDKIRDYLLKLKERHVKGKIVAKVQN